jgi:hypothetical protein
MADAHVLQTRISVDSWIAPGGAARAAADVITDPARLLPANAGPNRILSRETVGGLRSAGKKDAHHVIQDAAAKDLPGYHTNAAPGVQLRGPANTPGTPVVPQNFVRREM